MLLCELCYLLALLRIGILPDLLPTLTPDRKIFKIISLIYGKSLITTQLIQVYISIWKMDRGTTGNDDDLMMIE